jgi:flagellin-like hook-associated protein FlgL
MVQAFRGVGKSHLTSAYVVWRLLCDPECKILVISASKERADSFSTFTQRLIAELAGLEYLIPDSSQRNSKIAFDVGPAMASHSPSVKSVGITGQITGSRADLIVADDIEVLNNSGTQQNIGVALKNGGGYGTSGLGLNTLSVSTATAAATALTNIDAAIKTIDSARAELGATQNRFQATIRNLTNISENVSAARSRVRDTDFAKETAELTRQQILQQTSTTVLAQANQRPQAALSLLG